MEVPEVEESSTTVCCSRSPEFPGFAFPRESIVCNVCVDCYGLIAVEIYGIL